MKKKKVLICTDYPLVKTGLGKYGRLLAEYLYNTGKYDITYFACGVLHEAPEYSRFPYKLFGALPVHPQERESVLRDPVQARYVSYGGYFIDKMVQEVRPNTAIFLNDSWSFSNFYNKPWWDKINCLPVITLDSVPFLDDQKEFIKKSKHFYVWADFAERESHRLGFNHVKTLYGIVNTKDFYKLEKYKKKELRKKNNLSEDAYIVGFTFRNQIRKRADNLLEAFSIFKKENPTVKAYLLFVTNFNEPQGWRIHSFCENFGVDPNLVLTPYICKNCHDYEIKPYTQNELTCPYCKAEKAQNNIDISNGVSDQQLNEIYNLMNAYAHYMDAGGFEVPLGESVAAELPLSTVGYSSGETFTAQPFVFPVDFTFTVQHGTQFKRAIANPYSIAKQLKKIYEMPPEKLDKIGKEGRKWVVENFSLEVIGKKYEEIIDSMPEVTWDYNFETQAKNPNAVIDNSLNDEAWLESLYVKILCVERSDPSGKDYWLNLLKNGATREQIVNQFRNIAAEENKKNNINPIKLEDFLKDDNKKRVLLIQPESAGDIYLITSLFESIRKRYPKEEYTFYFSCKPEYFEILDGNPYIDRLIPFMPQFDNHLYLTGIGNNPGLFDVVYHPYFGTQRLIDYTNNGIDKHDLELDNKKD